MKNMQSENKGPTTEAGVKIDVKEVDNLMKNLELRVCTLIGYRGQPGFDVHTAGCLREMAMFGVSVWKTTENPVAKWSEELWKVARKLEQGIEAVRQRPHNHPPRRHDDFMYWLRMLTFWHN